MGVSVPQLVVGGFAWTGWTALTVQGAADQAARQFAATVTDSNGVDFADKWEFMPGTPVQVRESGELLLNGYIDRMQPSYEDKNHKVEISGRSKAGDAIDSSADHKSGEFRDKTILQIAQELDKQGVGFSSDVQGLQKIPLFRLNPYETVFAAVDRLARKQNLLLTGQPDGSIKIGKGGEKRVNAPLIEGDNIKGASATFDDSERHSEYKVKGQKAYGSSSANLRIEGSAKDSGVKRNRPKHLSPESDTDKDAAKKRANNHKDRKKGESLTASVKVQGWRDQNGVLYVPNTLIYVYSPMLKLDMDMLIKSVQFSMDGSGSHTQLSLVHPKALGSNAKSGSKTNKIWQWGDDG